MEAWKTLVNTALLGTEKRGHNPELVASVTGIETSADTRADTEAAFLRDTAILSAYRRGGIQPLRGEISFESAKSETRPYCNAASESALAEILHAGNTGLLRLWLHLAQSRQQLIPARHLAALLDAAQKLFVAHPQVRDTAGERGAWLAKLNPEWSYLIQSADENHWETGSTIERSAWLQRHRHNDPQKARELLEGVWDKEPADQRERLLATFESGLSHADLEFIERVLGDKSKRVTAQAAELLQKLPGSSIVNAFEDWLRRAVQMQVPDEQPDMVSNTEISFGDPEITDKRMLDALGKKPPPGISESKYRMMQISSFVPPDFWERHLDLSPEKALELLTEADPEIFPEALIAATDRFGNRIWADILARRAAVFHPILLPLLQPAEHDLYLEKFAGSQPDLVLQYYAQNDAEWLEEIAPALIAYAASQPYQYPKSFFSVQASRIPLSLLAKLDDIAPSLAASPEYMRTYAMQVWPANRLQLRDALELKAKILQSFT